MSFCSSLVWQVFPRLSFGDESLGLTSSSFNLPLIHIPSMADACVHGAPCLSCAHVQDVRATDPTLRCAFRLQTGSLIIPNAKSGAFFAVLHLRLILMTQRCFFDAYMMGADSLSLDRKVVRGILCRILLQIVINGVCSASATFLCSDTILEML